VTTLLFKMSDRAPYDQHNVDKFFRTKLNTLYHFTESWPHTPAIIVMKRGRGFSVCVMVIKDDRAAQIVDTGANMTLSGSAKIVTDHAQVPIANANEWAFSGPFHCLVSV
jgi:hypothetical protein